MAAKPKLTTEEWAKVRNTWESDPREGYAWLVESMALPVSAPGVRKVSLRDKWKKSEKPSKLIKIPKETSRLKPKSKVSKVSQRNHAKVSETIDIETIQTIEEEERKRGRPTMYKDEYVEQVYKLCILGATDKEIAEFFKVDESTVNVWKIKHPDFQESLRQGKMLADADMAVSLYKRGLGYSHPETHVSNYKGEITLTGIIKHYPPETGAAFLWLKNRQPDKWRDKVDMGIEVKLDRETLTQIEQTFIERMMKSRERQRAVNEERGILIEHGQD